MMNNSNSEHQYCAVIIDYLDYNTLSNTLVDELKKSFSYVLEIVKKLQIPYFIWSINTQENYFEGIYSFADISNQTATFEHTVFFHSNMPLLDIKLVQNIIDQQLKYFPDYTFYEFIPWGWAPFSLHKDCLKIVSLFMKGLDKQDYHPRFIHERIQKDINNYDIEILLFPDEIRFLKEDFFLKDMSSLYLIKKIQSEAGNIWELSKILKSRPSIIKGYPKFIDVSLTNQKNQAPIWLPNSLESQEYILSLNIIEKILHEFRQLEHFPTIQFSNRLGEPLLHPQIETILELCYQHSQFEFILETDGIELSKYSKFIHKIPNLTTIIHLSATSINTYQEIHGSNHFSEVESILEMHFNQDLTKTYVQYTRMNENEENIKDFMHRWQTFKNNIIIYQYNDFSSYLPDRKVIDLKPTTRFPCFKLQRELYIHHKGSIVLCLQDIQNTKTFELPIDSNTSILNVIEKLNSFYDKSFLETDLTPLCQKCDFWYIFNF